MSKKVLVISTSLRRHSNSHALAEEFAKGAKEAGHQVELISLIGRQIEYCVGCLSCQRTGQCVIEDDANLIAEKMLKADVVCYATPIYYYEMAGQMKTLLDRMNPLFLRTTNSEMFICCPLLQMMAPMWQIELLTVWRAG